MRVYVLTEGDYEDMTVTGVYSSLAQAQGQAEVTVEWRTYGQGEAAEEGPWFGVGRIIYMRELDAPVD